MFLFVVILYHNKRLNISLAFHCLVIKMNNDKLYWEITQRSLGVYSREEQEKIRKGKVAIVGVGCDGGMDAYILTRMGIGCLRLIDFDINELSNMNRQPMAIYSTRGLPKVYSAKSIIQDLNPTVDVESINAKLTEDNAEELLKGCDVALQGMDSMVGRIIFPGSKLDVKFYIIS